MKYKLETFPNEQMLEVHLKCKRLITTSFTTFDEPSQGMCKWQKTEDGSTISIPLDKPKIVDYLWEVPGIEQMSLKPYSITITKGGAFEWDDILPGVVNAINLVLCPLENMEREDIVIFPGSKALSQETLKKLSEA